MFEFVRAHELKNCGLGIELMDISYELLSNLAIIVDDHKVRYIQPLNMTIKNSNSVYKKSGVKSLQLPVVLDFCVVKSIMKAAVTADP